MVHEIWKYVEDFPDYAVSNLGNVINLRFQDRYLKASVNSRGYAKVTLIVDGHYYQRYVHQLVAEAFLGDWRPGLRIRHKDGDKLDNRVSNLEMITGVRRHGYVTNRERGDSRRVRIVETGEIFRTVYDCAAYIGGAASNIYKVLNGKRSMHLGLTFEYVD